MQLDELELTLSTTVTGSVPWVSAIWGLNPSLNMQSGMSRYPDLKESEREREKERERRTQRQREGQRQRETKTEKETQRQRGSRRRKGAGGRESERQRVSE